MIYIRYPKRTYLLMGVAVGRHFCSKITNDKFFEDYWMSLRENVTPDNGTLKGRYKGISLNLFNINSHDIRTSSFDFNLVPSASFRYKRKRKNRSGLFCGPDVILKATFLPLNKINILIWCLQL